MRRNRWIYFMIGAMLISFSGCIATSEGVEENYTETLEESVEKEIIIEEENTESGRTEEEQLIMELLPQYFDLKQYEENDGLIYENKIEDNINSIVIDGQTYKIGMSYQDVIAMGVKPVDPEFENTELSGLLAHSGYFSNIDNKIVRLAFDGEEGKKVSEGILYLVSIEDIQEIDNDHTFEVEGIHSESQIKDIVSALGEPYRINGPAYADYFDVGLKYTCKNQSVYLTFYVDLETEKIISVTMEGFPE